MKRKLGRPEFGYRRKEMSLKISLIVFGQTQKTVEMVGGKGIDRCLNIALDCKAKLILRTITLLYVKGLHFI